MLELPPPSNVCQGILRGTPSQCGQEIAGLKRGNVTRLVLHLMIDGNLVT